MRPRVIVFAATTGYQTRSFGEAAERLGVELVFATDRCHLLEDPWQDGAIAIKFHDEDAAVAATLEAARARPVDGVLAVGDRPTVIAARVAAALGLPWHPPAAAVIARHKERTREVLRDAGLLAPWWTAISISPQSPVPSAQSPVPSPGSVVPSAQSPAPSPQSPKLPAVPFPCVLKPVALSGSRGVMRADDEASLAAAFERLRALLRSPEVRAERQDAHDTVLIEGFIPGREYAVEGLMHHGILQVLALFDKPDPLDGPFFEETIYITPSSASPDEQARIVDAVTRAAAAIGLHHGPVHAECRVNAQGVFVLEAAARPIGGLCARSLRFVPGEGSASTVAAPHDATGDDEIPLEALLLRHALGENVSAARREDAASGVMMVPIPRRGIYGGVAGVEEARAVNGVDEIRITAKPDQLLVPLPEGASYLGFIFARASRAADVDAALRAAHAALTFTINPEFPMLTAAQIHYNLLHG